MRVAVLFLGIFFVPSGFVVAEESRSAVLLVSTTVVSSCSVSTSPDQVAYRCARGARGLVRINGQTHRVSADSAAVAERVTVTGPLTTIDF